jgi:hypothetical protein
MISIAAAFLAMVACADPTALEPFAVSSSVSSQPSSAQASSRSQVELVVGESTQLTSFLSRVGSSRSRVKRVEWTSRNSTVISVVSSTGRATALSPGRSWIVAAGAAGLDSVQVQVRSSNPIVVTPAAVSLVISATAQLSTNETGNVAWSSSNASVASVNSTGLVTAIAAGNARITAANSRGVTSFSDVSVASPPVPESGVLLTSPFADLPQRKVELNYPQTTGRTLRVTSGQSLQRAVDSARAGDEIVLARGVTLTESVTLPAKAMNGGWITIRGEGLAVPAGTRVRPVDFAGGARLLSPRNGEAAIVLALGASGYWLSGFEVSVAPAVSQSYTLLMLDAQATSATQIPTRIVIDRMYVHGTQSLEIQRCIYLGASNSQVVDSHISDCHVRGFDSQAILILTSEGPLLIRNNYLEGAGENVMIGGGAPTVSGVIPADIEIVRNHLKKPLEWQSAGWSVKNLLEVKFGRRIDIRENYLENSWVNAQTGYSVLIKAADQEIARWVRTDNITLRHNVLSNSAAGINIYADQSPVKAKRIAVLGNLVDRVGSDALGGVSRLVMLAGELDEVELRQNTFLMEQTLTPRGTGLMLDGSGASNILFTDNILDGGEYGIILSGMFPGARSLHAYTNGSYVFKRNAAVIGWLPNTYPADNLYVPNQAAFGFMSWALRDYRLGASSPLLSVPTPGARLESLQAAFQAR